MGIYLNGVELHSPFAIRIRYLPALQLVYSAKLRFLRLCMTSVFNQDLRQSAYAQQGSWTHTHTLILVSQHYPPLVLNDLELLWRLQLERWKKAGIY